MSKNKKVIQKFIDHDSGEYIELHEGDILKKISLEQQEAINKSIKTKEMNTETKNWNENLGGFVFVLFKYCDIILQQHPEIIPEDVTKLFYLATYVDYNGYLIYNDLHMTRNSMQALLKINRTNFDLFFNKMKDLDIIIQDEDKNIKINKEYFVKGEIDKEIQQYYNYTRVYIRSIRYLFENVSSRKHKQLGNYFKVIPYIHRQQNILCWNPNATKENLNLLQVKDLQEILNYHRNSARSFMNELLETRLENGEPIMVFIKRDKDDGKSLIIINPKVFYGGNFDLAEGKNSVVKWFNK